MRMRVRAASMRGIHIFTILRHSYRRRACFTHFELPSRGLFEETMTLPRLIYMREYRGHFQFQDASIVKGIAGYKASR